MKIPIVNEQDEIIEYKEKEETLGSDIRRIVSLHVFNEKGEVLIAKRHPSKKIHPNVWGPSVAGTVEEGDTCDSLVLKEAEEEIGLKNIKPMFLGKRFYETENNRRFIYIYYVTIDSTGKNFSLEENKVAEIKWINLKDLVDWFNKSPENFTPNFGNGTLADIKEIYAIKN